MTAIYKIRTRETNESVKALMKAHSPFQCVLFPFCSFHCIVHWLYTFTSPSIESQSSLDCSTQDKFQGLVLLGQGLEGMEGTSWVLSSKKNVIQKLLGQVDVTCMYSHTNTHFCVDMLFEVFPYSRVSSLTLIQYTSSHFISLQSSFCTSKYCGDFVLCLSNALTCEET